MGFEKFGKHGYVSQTKIIPLLTHLAKDELAGTRCRKCKTLHFPPKADCQNCRNSDMDWVPVAGGCILITFTEVHFAPPQFQVETPYLLGLAELKEGPRVFAPINNGVKRDSLKPGLPMTLRVVKRNGEALYYELDKSA